MEETINPSPAEEKTRPTFLTVLCVLSFIASGIGIYSSVTSFLKNPEDEMEKIQEATEKMGDAADSGVVGKIMEGSIAMMEHQQAMNTLSLICCVLTLFGAIMMWKLRKTGFWIYTASQVICLAGTFAILGVNFMSLMAIGFGGFFSVLFIVLYGVNLKHMS